MSSKPLSSYPPNLDDRFHAPENWQTGEFTHSGRTIYYGYVLTDDAKGTVVLLSGLSEFSEKYYETIKELVARGLSVFTLDWYGQGRSARYFPDSQKRHSTGFAHDAEDLDHFISAIVQPTTNAQTLVMLAHSMGGNMGLRYAIQKPQTFKAIAISAPMIGIDAIRLLPKWFVRFLLWILTPFHRSYISGGHDWHEDIRMSEDNEIFSSDPVRKEIHNKWCLHAPALQIGSPTFGWIKAATESGNILLCHDYSDFTIPCLFATAGDEKLVDNDATRRLSEKIPNCRLINIPLSKHEIMMETDEIRNRFWDGFDKLLVENGILT